MSKGSGWYVFTVENGKPGQLDDSEENIVNNFRFSRNHPTNATNPLGLIRSHSCGTPPAYETSPPFWP